MYLRGGTEPPQGSADYFTYDIRALARSRPFADLNDDGSVNAADYVMLRKNASAASADVATHADWIQQFGETVPDLGAYDAMMSAALGSLAVDAVPEPASIALVLTGGILLFGWRRR